MRSDSAAGAVREVGATPVAGDLLDEAGVAAAMAGCDVGFHVAGVNTLCPSDPSELERINVGGAAAVARAAADAGLPRLVHTSSSSAIGEPKGTIGREDTPHRGWYLSDYDRTKHAGERAVLEIGAERGLDVVCVNPASVQGPGRATGTAKMLLAQLDGRLKVFVDTRISVVDIDDCTRGHLLAAERGAPGERYILCGVTLTSEEALALLRGLSGRDERPGSSPRPSRRRSRAPWSSPAGHSIATRPHAARWPARCCTATPTTGRARPVNWASSTRRWRTRCAAPRPGRGTRACFGTPSRGSPSHMERNPDDRARPEQAHEESFAEGQEQRSDDDETVRDFAEGQEQTPHEKHGDFAEGQEHHDHADDDPEGDFATGQRENPEP